MKRTVEQYMDWNRSVEGAVRDDSGQHVPYRDSAGNWTAGYGRLLSEEEAARYSLGVSEDTARQWHSEDVGKAYRGARSAVVDKYGQDAWDVLGETDRLKLTDFAYNVGPGFADEFPKYTEAVVRGDRAAQAREYERSYRDPETGEMVPLGRNDAFRDFFDMASRPTQRLGESEGAEDSPPSGTGARVRLDPKFQGMSTQDQVDHLRKNDPAFDELYKRDPERAEGLARRIGQQRARADPSFFESVQGGAQAGFGMPMLIAANTLMVLEEAGLIGPTDLDDNWRTEAEQMFVDGGNKIGGDWYDLVGAVIGGLPGGIAIPGLATAGIAAALPLVGVSAATSAAIAPVVGFGLAGGLSAAHEGPQAALRRGAIDAALGAIYPATMHLSRLSRMGVESAAAYAVSDADDPFSRLLEAATFGTIAGMPGRRSPLKVLQRLGIEDKVGKQAASVALREAQLDASINARAKKNLQESLYVGDGKFEGDVRSLEDLFKLRNRLLRDEHPMSENTVRPDLDKINIARSNERANEIEILPAKEMNWTKEKSQDMMVGPQWVDFRKMAYNPDWVPKLFGKELRRGAILERLARALGVPIQAGVGKKRVRGYRVRDEGDIVNKGPMLVPNRRMIRLADRGDLQTGIHEIGHDFTRRNKVFTRWFDFEDPDFQADWDRMLMAYKDMLEGLSDKRVTQRFMFANKDQLPEDLRYIPELLSVSYDITMPSEGIAELARLWATQPIRPKGKYWGEELPEMPYAEAIPHVWKKFEDGIAALPKKERNALYRFRKEAMEFLDAGTQPALISKFGPDVDPAAALDTAGVRWRQKVLDDLSGIRNVELKSTGFLGPGGPYEAFRLLRGTAELNSRMVYWGAPTLVDDPIRPGTKMVDFTGESLQDIFAVLPPGAKHMQRALEYITGIQAKELKSQAVIGGKIHNLDDLNPSTRFAIKQLNMTREKLFSDEEISTMLRYGDENPSYKVFAAKMKQYADRITDFGEDAGLWNKKQRDRWHRQQFIFSFFREMNERAAKGDLAARAISGQRPTRMLRGSDRNLRDPLMNMMETYSRTVSMSMENMAKRKLVDYLANVSGGGRFIEVIKAAPKMRGTGIDEVMDGMRVELKRKFPRLTEFGDDTIDDMLKSEFSSQADVEKFAMFAGRSSPYNNERILTVYRNGKPEYYSVLDDALLSSLQAVRRPGLFGVENHWNNFRRFKQRWITRDPSFMVANFVRDTAMASVMSKTGHFHLNKAIGGLISAFRQDEHYRSYIANGGGGAGLGESMDQLRHRLVRHAERKGFDPRGFLVTPKDVLGFLDEVGRSMEVASRLGEYKAARKKGLRASTSAYMGREVSTDFSVRGDSRNMNFLSNTVPFFNAMIAGSDRFYRGLMSDPSHRAATFMKTGMLAMASMALYMNNRTIPEYNDLPPWAKKAYWHFYVPKYDAEGNRLRNPDGTLAHHHFKMPKLWEVGLIGTGAEMMLGAGLEDAEWGETFADMGNMIAANYGLNLADRGLPVPIPVGADVLVEQYSNRINFTGNPIETAGMHNLQVWQRKRSEQPRVFGEWGKLMRDIPVPDMVKSPARAEALLRGVFGEWAMIGAHFGDSVFFPGGPAMHMDELPVIRRGYERWGKYSKHGKEFYDRLEQYNQTANTFRSVSMDPQNQDVYAELAQDPDTMRKMSLYPMMDNAASSIRRINKQIDMLRSGNFDREYSPTELRQKIEELQRQKRMIQKRYNQAAKKAERAR